MPCLIKKSAAIGIILGLFLFFSSTEVHATNTYPLCLSVVPACGVSDSYQPVNFVSTYFDTKGCQDIKQAFFLVNVFPVGARCLYGYYNSDENKLYLRNDSNSGWVGGYSPGTAGTIENSYCKLDCSKSSVTKFGKTLIVKWNVSFKSTFSGIKHIYLLAKDKRNSTSGWVYRGRWKIKANLAPVAGTIFPSSGSGPVNIPNYFTTIYSDPNSEEDIHKTYFLISNSLNKTKCFFAHYDRKVNKLYLRDDNDSAWLGGYVPGSNNVIENSFCELDCSQTFIDLISKTSIAVKWAIKFKSGFTGNKKCFLLVKDNAGASSRWVKRGAWVIEEANRPPDIIRVLPEDSSVFLSGASVNIILEASDPDNDYLQYQFSIAGSIMQKWSDSNQYAWQTTPGSIYSVDILCEVKDPLSASVSRRISCSVINPTVEEILQKVKDNYSKISDFSADMVLSSTLDGEPFGVVDYCRYFFKAPNKEKTETFNDISRGVKNDIIIINGTNMHLINPVKDIKQTVDLLSENEISNEVFSQLDIYYNPESFLSKHLVYRMDSSADFNNMILALDAKPNESNKAYDSLSIWVDYSKGLITKLAIYKINSDGNNELLEQTAAIDFQKLPNDAWLPIKMTKTPKLAEGSFVSTVIYSNLISNQGISDDIFNPELQ